MEAVSLGFIVLQNKIVINTEKFKIHWWGQQSDSYSKIGGADLWFYRPMMLSEDILNIWVGGS